jgi:uncharacterized protein YeaO (DUF488 family)
MVAIKRAYEAPSRDDGTRILGRSSLATRLNQAVVIKEWLDACR